jgi:Uma2 family endonuclease
MLKPVAAVPSLPNDGRRFEIVDGILKEKPPMGMFANILASFLATAINSFSLPKRLGMAIAETAYQLEPRNARRPDVSYYEFAKFPSVEVLYEDPPAFECSPNLAIEVISPSNTVAVIDKRIEHFFATGVKLAWIVHPQSKQVHVYESPTDCKILKVGDVLDGEKVLPEYSLSLAELFNVSSLLP